MTNSQKRIIIKEHQEFTYVNKKEDNMGYRYMMDVNDVMNELEVKKSKAYAIIRQLNRELEDEGYRSVRGKIPRAYWEKKYYGYSDIAV